MSPLLASIVIPVYNRAHLVSRAIESALAQTVPCEILVVDHGSTDGIASVVSSYGDRIHYVRREIDNGPIACWIDGAERSSCEFLHFTYDDDWLKPTFIERCIEAFSDDIAFVYTRATVHNSALEPQGVIFQHPSGTYPVKHLVRHLLSKPLTISPGCATFRRRDVLKNLIPEIPEARGIYGKNSGVGEDLLLFLLTTLEYNNYAHIGEPLADFLSHSGSITVSAQTSGNKGSLVDAYSVAKSFYLSKPGAIRPLNAFQDFLFQVGWTLKSRGLPSPFL